ncbi:MAG: lipopolysaccharide transport periplasmic protein LptA [Pseudomonadota bacterium]|jgi:lipopolysaccharide export system protein LptA
MFIRLPLTAAHRILVLRHTLSQGLGAFLLLLGLCGASGWAYAERADRQKPLHAEADVLRYDDNKQLSIFTGNVVITKGTITIRGDRVEVRQDNQGHQFGTVIGASNALAFFRQKREGVDEFIEGEAERIEYNGQADIVQFISRAVMRRYRGATLTDETAGSKVTYDNNKDTFVVEGGAQRTADNPSGRVRAVLTPTPKAEGTPANAAPTTGPALKPSTSGINGSKP